MLQVRCPVVRGAGWSNRGDEPSKDGRVLGEMVTIGWHLGNDGFICVALVAVIVFLATSTRRTARRCPRCKEVNREAAIFCAQCGQRLRHK